MGCSPSRGHTLSGVQDSLKKGRTLLPDSHEGNAQAQLDDGSSVPGEVGGEDSERGAGGGGGERFVAHLSQKQTQLTIPSLSEVTLENATSDKLCAQQIEINISAHSKEAQGDADEEMQGRRGGRKSKKCKGNKLIKKKDKEKKSVEQKVDFPEPLVKAHQAAYTYLNPSIDKYEVLLSLVDQAAQTQLSLQPMVTFMVLRYEQVNHILSDIADEGERMLKDNGEHLAWPSPLKHLSANVHRAKETGSSESPPDLLQQLLQYTTQRMRIVSHSVGNTVNTALQEAAEYFASLSELLQEKLKAKKATEARLNQLLARIESAALCRPSPDDCALYSEDSGIGGDSWSLAESEHRRESWDSVGTVRPGCGSPDSISSHAKRGASRHKLRGKMSPSLSLNSVDSTSTIIATESLLGSASLDESEGDDKNNKGGQTEQHEQKEDCEVKTSKQGNSFPSNLCCTPRRIPLKRIENPQNVEMTLKLKEAISGQIRFISSQRNATRSDNSNRGVALHWLEEEEKQSKRPQSAALVASPGTRKRLTQPKQHRSRSAESLRTKAEDPTLLELERTQKDLSQRLEKMTASRSREADRGTFHRRGGGQQQPSPQSRQSSSLPRNLSTSPKQERAQRRRNSKEEKEVSINEEPRKEKEKKAGKGPLRVMPPPSTPPSLAEQPSSTNRGRNSVKKLIDTFSQGVEEKRNQGNSRSLGPLRGVKKCGIPVMPGLESRENINYVSSSNSHEGLDPCVSHKGEDLDLDNLPPPPPEVLMDNSFETAQEAPSTHDGNQAGSKGRSPLLQRTTISQRLRASVQSVAVLPSRSNLQCGPPVSSSAWPVQEDATGGSKDVQQGAELQNEEAALLYEQSRKIIHLPYSTELPTEKQSADTGTKKASTARSGEEVKQAGGILSETVPSTSSGNIPRQSVTTPPVSRVYMPPSTPSIPPSQHRRLPSPPAFKRQPTPSTSGIPSASRKLPTPPSGQRTMPSPPQLPKAISSSSSQWKTPSPPLSKQETATNATSYPFKSPSTPASPRVQKWSRDNSSEEVVPLPSSAPRASSNAHSVFCPASPSLFEAQPRAMPRPPQAWTPAGASVLPKPWAGTSRSRLSVPTQSPQPFIRRNYLNRRPSLNLPTRTPAVSIAESCGSEPAISTHGLDDGPIADEPPWGNQSDLRANNRSSSHPELCIVGQALQRE
ncbi:hypothetical protein GN956_G18631 [Arapaima gigas]